MCIYSTRICVQCRQISEGRAGTTKRILSNHRCDRAMNRNERCSHLRRGPTYYVYSCLDYSYQRFESQIREQREANQNRLDQDRAKHLLEHLRGEHEHAVTEEQREERRRTVGALRRCGARLHDFLSDDPLSMSQEEREILRRAPHPFQRAFQEMMRRQEEIDRTGRALTLVDRSFRWSNLVYHFERSEGSQFDLRNRSSALVGSFGLTPETVIEQSLRYEESPESATPSELSAFRLHVQNVINPRNEDFPPEQITIDENHIDGSQNEEQQHFEPLEPDERKPISFAEMVDNLTSQAPARSDIAPEERLQNLIDEYGGYIGNEFSATYVFNWRDTIEAVMRNNSNWDFTPEPTSQIQEPGTEALAFRAWFEQQRGQTLQDAQESWHWEAGLRYLLEALTQYTEYLRVVAPQAIEALMAAREVEVENRLRQLRGE